MARPLNRGLSPNQLLHRKSRGNPRTAAAGPARVVIHIHLQAKTSRFGAHVFEEVNPGSRAELDRTLRRALIHVHNRDSPYPGAFHRFKIRGDGVAVDIAIEPEPEHPRTCRVRWMHEALFQSGAGCVRWDCTAECYCEADRSNL